MRRIARHVMSAFLLCAAFSTASAQESYVKEGATIRFQTDSGRHTHTGQLALLTSDSLFLQRCATCTRLSYGRAEVGNLAVFHPADRGHRFLSGLAIGALVGGGLGYLSAATCHQAGEGCDLAAAAIPVGIVFGGLVGGVAGVLSAYKWDPITTDGR